MSKKPKREFEVKVLDFDKESVINTLRQLGAQEFTEVLLKRYVFDFSPPETHSEWIRLRTDGTKTHLTYKKKPRGKSDLGQTEEIEVEVEVTDFTTTAEILRKITFEKVLYQENKRHLFKIKDIEFSIDSWPLIDPILEIESTDEKKVMEGLKLLSLEDKHVGDLDIKHIYEKKGLKINSYAYLSFDKQLPRKS